MSLKIQKLKQKITLCYEEIEQEFMKMNKKDIINKAYELSRYQNIADAIINWCDNFEDDKNNIIEYFVLDKNCVDKIIKFDGNVIKSLKDGMSDICHFERYNLDDWDNDLPFLIEEISKRM